MLKLIIGRAGTGKSTLLLRRACARDGRRHILLVPETQSHETERRLCAAGGGWAGQEAEVLSFSRLASRVFQTAGGLAREELDAGGRVLLMYRAAQTVSDRLTRYARPSRKPAFLTGLLATADELKSCCVPPEELIRAGEELGGSDGERLRDLGLICAAYAALTEQIALDPRDRLTRAAEKLAACEWAEGALIYLDGFIDFTPQQMRLIRLLLQQAEEVTVALTCDHLEEDEGGVGIFSAARHTAAQLLRLAEELGQEAEVETLDQPSPARSPAMRAVEAGLFGAPGGEKTPCGDDVQLFEAPDMRTEVEWTAARILELVRGGDFRFRDVGVIARGYERYDELIESVFSQYGVPVFRSAMSDVMRKPVLTLVTAALDAVTGGYTYDDVFRYLKTDLVDVSRQERDELENYVLRWDIRGSRWTQPSPWNRNPRGYAAMTEEDRAALERIDAVRRRVAMPLEKLRKNTDKTGKGQAKRLYRFLEEIRLAERLEERAAGLRERGELGLAEEYRQLWEILCRALEQCAVLLGDVSMEAEEFARLLRLVLSQYDVGTIPVSLDRVTAGELTRQSGHGVSVLFLLGADDASIPGMGVERGLLTDDDREMLAGAGIELGLRGRDRLYREMTAVYTAFTCPDRKLIVTWPSAADGEKTQPCFAVGRLRRIFPELETGRAEGGAFRLAAPRPALELAGTMEPVRRALERMPQWSRAAGRVAQAGRWERGRLSRDTVDRLYGRHVPMSASRMDKYKSCHFAYFMGYGLRAESRRKAFNPASYGTFVHDVLEHVIADGSWRTPDGGVDGEILRAVTRAAAERYVREEMGGMEQETDRFRYLFRRLLDGVDQVAANVAQELAASRFRPLAFELGFGEKEGRPVRVEHDGVEISLTGFVDRVDGYEKDGKLYLRVVDYKTGKKVFDLTEVANGIGLQMLVYLFTLQSQGETLFGREIVPAGVLYLPARTAVVKGSRSMPEDKLRAQRDKELRRRGLILDDEDVLDAMERPGENGKHRFLPLDGKERQAALVTAERFTRLEKHVRRVMEEICSEMAAGSIAADPFWRGPEQNACRWCEFAAACHFEPGRGGDCRRRAKVDPKEFWKQMEQDTDTQEEVSGDGL